MDDIEGGAVEGTEVQAPAALGRERRMTAGRKREAVLRLLRGEPLEVVARELAVTAADLSAWRDAFLEAGEASLKSRPRDDRDATIGRLRTKVGELTMDNELLYAKVERLEGGAPFAPRTPEAMSAVVSISTRRRYGIARVCRVWGVARSGVYRLRRAADVPPAPRRRPGPLGSVDDIGLVTAIRRVLAESPFHGEGYRKVWARLRHAGLRTSKERVRRLMRENGLSAASRVGRPRGPRNHDGTIIPERVDAMWDEPSSAIGPRTMANDMTTGFTLEHGQVAVFVAVDHCSAECTGIHAALRGTRHEALEPIRQGVVERLGAVGKDMAAGLSIRHDHGKPVHGPRLPARDRLARGRVLTGLCPRAGGQRLRRALHPDAEGEPPLGPDLRHRRGAPPRPDRLQTDLQRKLADRAARPPLARPVPTQPDGRRPPGRVTAIRCPKIQGRYTLDCCACPPPT